MRLAAQFKMGFYAAAPEAVQMVAAHLKAPAGKRFTMLDPCAGEGKALATLGHFVGDCNAEDLYAVELDEDRAATLRENLPTANVLGPASVFGVDVGYGSMSVMWLNPPFDDEFGGGRAETHFLRQATRWLTTGGVLCFVCPERVVKGSYYETEACQYLAQWYDSVTVLAFPEGSRPFNEVAVLAVKRKEPVKDRKWADCQAPEGTTYAVPPSDGRPVRFAKTGPTELELKAMLLGSPLRKLMEVVPERELARPPLPVNAGHRAMLLAAGHLDGLVCPKGEAPHVVRGTARKDTVLVTSEVLEDKDGNETVKEVFTEQVKLVVRVVDAHGELHTLMEG